MDGEGDNIKVDEKINKEFQEDCDNDSKEKETKNEISTIETNISSKGSSENLKSDRSSLTLDTDLGSGDFILPDSITPTSISDIEDEFVIFHNIYYLGASAIQEPNSEKAIRSVMTFLNAESKSVIQCSVSVPLKSNGSVIIYEEKNQLEISRFGINQIVFFARGAANGSETACFAFTCSHGETLDQSIFQCHSFKCDIPEAVGRVFKSFARAFESPPPKVPLQKCSSQFQNQSQHTSKMEFNNQPVSPSEENYIFEVTLEIKEDDGKGNYSSVKGDKEKGYFRLRSCVAKQLSLTVQQIPDCSKELYLEKCFGLLLSPGRHVRNSDMQLVETISMSFGTNSYDKREPRAITVTGQWDHNDPAFESLNHETAKDSCVFFTVAVDLVIKGIIEPIRFALETKAKVYSSIGGLYRQLSSIGRKHHYTQQFRLSLKRVNQDSIASYEVLGIATLGEVDKGRPNFNMNFTSFIRSSSVNSIDSETPVKEEAGEESDDDEPLQSGMGEIKKDCTEEQITSWSQVLSSWPPESQQRPKNLGPLVKLGIPDTLRGEIWLRLAGCQNDAEMMTNYKNLLSKSYSNEDIILRDINRTFPANDYFRENGDGQELLYKISKAYALYDSEIGYCQGISFISASLLLLMPEEQAFCLLVKIMYDYGFRNLFRENFENLHLKLYQLTRLIEEQIPELYAHFEELSIEGHYYASQWFLTLFTAKFPLNFVFRAIDLFLLEGNKTLFQIALALLSASRKDLLVLDFEGILKYFRVNIPKKYRTKENTDALIKLALQLKVKKIAKYESEYLLIKEQERNKVDPLIQLRIENKRLMEDKIRFDYMITKLVLAKSATDDHIFLIEDEFSKTKTSLKEIEDFNQRLKEESNSVKELFQKEVIKYDSESEKKSNIISDYKKICSNLSTQLEEEKKVAKERLKFFHSNLCEKCSIFIDTALNLASEGVRTESPLRALDNSTSNSKDDILQPLENELAKTKIALAESECRNDDLQHQILVLVQELETFKQNKDIGPAWLWKNFRNNKTSSNEEPSSINNQL